MDKFTDEELVQLRRHHGLLADLCNLHGQTDGFKAHRATSDAIKQEITERGRGKG